MRCDYNYYGSEYRNNGYFIAKYDVTNANEKSYGDSGTDVNRGWGGVVYAKERKINGKTLVARDFMFYTMRESACLDDSIAVENNTAINRRFN